MKSILLRLAVYACCCVFFNSAWSQQVSSDDVDIDKKNKEKTVVEDRLMTVEQQLLQMQKDLNEKEKEKETLERKLRKEKDEVVKAQLQQELVAAEDIIVGMQEEIVKSATGGATVFKEPVLVKEEFDWKKDMELLFQPFVDQLRTLTEQPRLIEKTESEIGYWQRRRQELQEAANNLDKNISTINDSTLKKEVQALRDTTGSRLNSAEQKLSLLQNELEALKTAKSPIWTTIGDIFVNIVFEILLHLSFAVLAAVLAYQAIKWLSVIIINVLPKNKVGDHKFAQRSIEIGRLVLGSVVTIVTYFIVLYSLTEWLLIVVSLLIVASLALGLRETLPGYMVEAKTLLNMGSIRHGERLIYNGLPWRINRLNVHSHLHNPALNGRLRVSLTEIVNLSSRPIQRDEAWFPTKTGDFVLMEDGVYGRVNQQTPDIVEIDRGHSIYTYTTADFLSRRPCNLSKNGFTLYETFGIDYQHQANITTTILDTYRQAMEEAIKSSPYGQFSTEIVVVFSMAAASSLDFRIVAGFSGDAAQDYYAIKRLIQRASVDVANREGWVIPFQQITLHYDSVGEK